MLLLPSIILSQLNFTEPSAPPQKGGSLSAPVGNVAMITRTFSELFADHTYFRTLFLYIIFAVIGIASMRLICKYRLLLSRFNLQKTIYYFHTTNERETYA
jgi:hypothetical protein